MLGNMSPDNSNFASDLWRYKPIIIILAAAGFIVFVLLVIDTYRHRQKQKGREPKKH
jgi:heme/copper-type cytochrome/quinol oxidase subunit 2